MKRLYLLIVSFCALQVSFAQTAVVGQPGDLHADRTQNIKKLDRAIIDNIRAQSEGFRSPTFYWVNFSDAVDYTLTGDEDYANFAYTILWPDSTVKIVDPVDGDFFWRIHGYMQDFDPISGYLANYVNGHETLIGDAEDWFTEDHGFDIDSVRFYFFYDRYNTDYTDTLKVYLMSQTSNVLDESGYYFDQDANGIFDEGTDISLILNKYNSSENRPNGSFTEVNILLDDDDSSSTNATYRTIPVDFHIAGNSAGDAHTVGIAFQYKPGQPYSFGDTLGDLSDPPLEVFNPLNRLTLICYEEQAGLFPISWSEYSNNQDAIATWEVRYDLSPGGFNGYYIPTTAYDETFTLEHAYVDWLVAPKGAYFIANKPAPCVDLTLNFTDLSNFVVDAGSATYFWDFGDGGVEFGQEVSHVYAEPGTYTICQIVTEGATSYQYCKASIVDFCVGVNNIDDLNKFLVYPVPAKDALNLDLDFSKPENIAISITDIQGQILYQNNAANVSTLNQTIDISQFAAGTYILEVNTNEQSATKNFVITR